MKTFHLFLIAFCLNSLFTDLQAQSYKDYILIGDSLLYVGEFEAAFRRYTKAKYVYENEPPPLAIIDTLDKKIDTTLIQWTQYLENTIDSLQNQNSKVSKQNKEIKEQKDTIQRQFNTINAYNLANKAQSQLELQSFDSAYYHAKAAYNILKNNGIPLSKHVINALGEATFSKFKSVYQPAQTAITGIIFSPKGDRFLSIHQDSVIRIWNWSSKHSIELTNRKLVHIAPIIQAAFSPDGNKIASITKDKSITLWNLNSLDEEPEKATMEVPLHNLFFSPNGKNLITYGTTTIFQLELSEGSWKVSPPHKCEAPILSATFSKAGKKVIIFQANNQTGIWDPVAEEKSFLSDNSLTYLKKVLPKRKEQLLTKIQDGKATYWDLWMQESFAIAYNKISLDKNELDSPLHHDRVNTVQFSNDRQQILSASADQTAKLFHFENGLEMKIKQYGSGDIPTAIFTPDHNFILAGTESGHLIYCPTLTSILKK